MCLPVFTQPPELTPLFFSHAFPHALYIPNSASPMTFFRVRSSRIFFFYFLFAVISFLFFGTLNQITLFIRDLHPAVALTDWPRHSRDPFPFLKICSPASFLFLAPFQRLFLTESADTLQTCCRRWRFSAKMPLLLFFFFFFSFLRLLDRSFCACSPPDLPPVVGFSTFWL